MRSSVYSVILGGGEGKRLEPLTRKMAKPVVPVAATTNSLNYAIGALVGCGCSQIDIFTQYKSESIADYVGKYWWPILDRSIRLQTVPPIKNHAYRGTAHAMLCNLERIKESQCSHVIITAGDHVSWVDYDEVWRFCLSKHADAVIMAMPVPKERAANNFGVLEVDDRHGVHGFDEKPKVPMTMPKHPETALASMGIYVFKADFLIRLLKKIQQENSRKDDFGHDVIPMIIAQGAKVFAYYFKGYWEDLGSIQTYHKFHVEDLFENLLGKDSIFDPYVNPFNPDLCFKQSVLRPAYIHDAAIVKNVIIPDGCEVKKSMLEQVVLSPGVFIGTGVNLKRVTVHPNVRINEGSFFEDVIVGEGAVIPSHTIITPRENNYQGIYLREDGITVII